MTKKFFIIASTEYEANWPDLFVMDAEGNYYGVSENSYARWDDFPKSVNHWNGREGSDAGRYFNIDEVEIPTEQVEKFEALTQEYRQIQQTIDDNAFPEKAPVFSDYKTKRSFTIARNKWSKRYDEWRKEHNMRGLIRQSQDKWNERIRLFVSFSKKVSDAISDNHCIQRALTDN